MLNGVLVKYLAFVAVETIMRDFEARSATELREFHQASFRLGGSKADIFYLVVNPKLLSMRLLYCTDGTFP